MNKMATGKQRTGNRMQSIECFRLISALMIATAHCMNIEGYGLIVNCLARVTVPFFFVVSGFFSYQVSEKTIRKRFWAVVKLTIVANLLYCLWDCYHAEIRDFTSLMEWLKYRCSSEILMEMLLLNRGWLREHLWYMHTIIVCYAAMWIYVRWSEKETCSYKPLYITSVCLFSIHIVVSSFATACGFEDPYQLYRNALLYGLPVFSLGIFLREYNDKIIRAYNLTKIKLIGLAAAGVCLVFLQFKGTGKVELPIGALVEVIALLLLFVMVPTVSKGAFLSGMISKFGDLSTFIYITHMIWWDVYNRYVKEYALRLGETKEIFIFPMFVVTLSLISGVLYLGIKSVNRNLRRSRKLPEKV